MAELETQVAKIEVWDVKASTAYVFLMAETASSGAELYVVCELPLFNPAAGEDAKRISLAIAGALKRGYRRGQNANSFENALTEINEELGKLAGLGQTTWIGKLNALVAVKAGTTLSIATTGKITALLLRAGEVTAVTDTAANNHPLKTFENFSIGKLKLNDKLVLSTNQLLNFLSLDRLKKILEQNSLQTSAEQVMQILQDQAGPDVAFASLLLDLSPSGNGPGPIQPAVYTKTTSPGSKLKTIASLALPVAKEVPAQAKKLWQATVSKIKNRSDKSLIESSKEALQSAGQSAANTFSVSNYKKLSTTKKFFLLSALVLVIALGVNIYLTGHYKQTKQAQTQLATLKSDIQKMLNDANAAFIFRDEGKAKDLISQAEAKLADSSLTAAQRKDLSNTFQSQIDALKAKLEHRTAVNPSLVATLTSSDHLIKLPGIIATQVGTVITSYNLASGKTEDTALISSDKILSSSFIKDGLMAIYTGSELKLWNYKTSTTSAAFSQNVPANNKAVGLIFYTNNRVYTVDSSQSTVVNFLVGTNSFSKPIVAIKNSGDLSAATDLAIDGSVYIYNGANIQKYSSGKLVNFSIPSLYTPLGSGGKIFTAKDVTNLYVLDSANKRILILDKKGGLISDLTSDQFTNLKDFVVDEKGKTMYILNGSSLLKVNF